MTVFSGALAEAYNAWLDSLSSCYATISPCLNGRNKDPSHQLREKDEFLVLRDQPALTPPPTLGPSAGTAARGEAFMEQRPASVRRGKGRGRRGFSVAKRFWSHGSSSSRRPKISAPSDFRHIHSESFQFPPASQPGRRSRSFRPLELSIYVDDNLSPILPHLISEQSDVFPPAPAHMHSSSFDSNGSTLTHQRTLSSMSFHLQRRPVPRQAGSASTQDSEDPETPPRIPPRSRMRARSSAEQVDRMVERVASAMLERDRLQAEIESIVERHSIYMSSRPSTAYDMQNLEPMPEIPALPAAGRPSFVERLSIEQISTERPRTAPPKNSVQGAGMGSPIYEVPDVFHVPQMPMQPRYVTPSPSTEMMPQRRLAPPLPLVLRPPLRKKRSFSRVSNWLFPADDPVQHQRGMSFDSVTNAPLPITDRDGFYTCVAPARRTSFETISTSCSWDTQTEERTQPTTMSVTDSPSAKEARLTTPTGTPRLNRTATFGRTYSYESRQHRPQSVGVAF